MHKIEVPFGRVALSGLCSVLLPFTFLIIAWTLKFTEPNSPWIFLFAASAAITSLVSSMWFFFTVSRIKELEMHKIEVPFGRVALSGLCSVLLPFTFLIIAWTLNFTETEPFWIIMFAAATAVTSLIGSFWYFNTVFKHYHFDTYTEVYDPIKGKVTLMRVIAWVIILISGLGVLKEPFPNIWGLTCITVAYLLILSAMWKALFGYSQLQSQARDAILKYIRELMGKPSSQAIVDLTPNKLAKLPQLYNLVLLKESPLSIYKVEQSWYLIIQRNGDNFIVIEASKNSGYKSGQEIITTQLNKMGVWAYILPPIKDIGMWLYLDY